MNIDNLIGLIKTKSYESIKKSYVLSSGRADIGVSFDTVKARGAPVIWATSQRGLTASNMATEDAPCDEVTGSDAPSNSTRRLPSQYFMGESCILIDKIK
ncbi:hypothetical protein CBL_07069 [Carabus blaptoides fortunei]